jgi:hypothetical protein
MEIADQYFIYGVLIAAEQCAISTKNQKIIAVLREFRAFYSLF